VIGIQETMRDSFLDTELSKLGGNKDCVWNWAFCLWALWWDPFRDQVGPSGCRGF
jgi:hypothetical protein